MAERAKVSLQTIRYYEREGLLPKPPRLASGYRTFPDSSADRVRFIKRAQELGFSLAEIRELLSMGRGASAQEMRNRAKAKVAEIERKIRALREMKSALNKLTESCPGCGPLSECPILDAMGARGVLV